MVLASSPELIEDVKKAPEDVLSVSIPRTEASLPPRTLYLYSYRLFSSFSLNLQRENWS